MRWLNSVLCGIKWLLGYDGDQKQSSQPCLTATPFIWTRQSSMYFDDDGDLAHEFYMEVQPDEGKPWMQRITEGLTWQGLVPLDKPRLHYDFPIVFYQAE